MIWKAVVLLCATLGASCQEQERHHHGVAVSEQHIVQHFHPEHHGELGHIGEHKPKHREEYAWSYPSYEFSYKVADPHTHDFKGQHELRVGDLVRGEYWLVEPDGNKRTVKYHADDKTGFLAEVHNSKPRVHLEPLKPEKKPEAPEKLQVKPVSKPEPHHEPKHKQLSKVHIESYIHHQPIKHDPISNELRYALEQERKKEEEHHKYHEERKQEERRILEEQHKEHLASEERNRQRQKSHQEKRIQHEHKIQQEQAPRHAPVIHYDEHIHYEPRRHEEHRERSEERRRQEDNSERREPKKQQEERVQHLHEINNEEHHYTEERIPEEFYRLKPIVHHEPRHRVEYERHRHESKKAAEEVPKQLEQPKRREEDPKIPIYKPKIEDEESYGWLPKHLEHRPRYHRHDKMQRPIVVAELN